MLRIQVGLTKGVDSWLLNLKQQVTKSLHDLVLNIANDCSNGVPFEEWILKVSEIISHTNLKQQGTS